METQKLTDLKADTRSLGERLTTAQGLHMEDDQNSLTAGERGATLLEDFHLREKIMHFDHERIPERVVHARGVAAHGYFEAYEDASDITAACPFAAKGKRTPVFLRFSTVAGSRGSADTPRDVRGFAVKFYTEEGVWDMVGNNIPVFFIQDAIKFPDLIHAAKPEPDTEVPQAQTAHDTFWDFVSLSPESSHMLMWIMSDRTLPRSLSTMEGFGVHTFRFINAKGEVKFVKFHFLPHKGIHSLVWDESQKIGGKDPDFHRKDLYESIENGDFPTWDLAVQVFDEATAKSFDFDVLDPTKIIPVETVPLRRLGRLVLNRNPTNYFAETEQVAFHPGHVIPGIDFTNDPLLQGRLFSYLDTQITRIGQNFAELPINRPVSGCPVHNLQRDGKARIAIDEGKVAYFPNSLGKNRPAPGHGEAGMHGETVKDEAPPKAGAFRTAPAKVEGCKLRRRPESFQDHYSQATLFWNSMAPWEKEHIMDGFSFELNMCKEEAVRSRVMNTVLVNIHPDLAEGVSKRTSIPITNKGKCLGLDRNGDKASPALSMNKPAPTVAGRKIAVHVGEGVNADDVMKVKEYFSKKGCKVVVVGPMGRHTKDSNGKDFGFDVPAPNAPSVVVDAVIVPGGADSHAQGLSATAVALDALQDAFVHYKFIGGCGSGVEVLQGALPRVPAVAEGAKVNQSEGIAVCSCMCDEMLKAIEEGLLAHRAYDRNTSFKK